MKTLKKPKYEIGQTVWMMKYDRPQDYTVCAIVQLEDGFLYGCTSLYFKNEPQPLLKWLRDGLITNNWEKLRTWKEYNEKLDIDLYKAEALYASKQSLIESL